MKLQTWPPRALPDDASGLTTAESLIWAGQSLDPTSPLYNMAMALDVEGALDIGRLRRAWALLVEGDDVLRTLVREVDGQPRRFVSTETDVDFEVIERLGPLDEVDVDALLHTWTAAPLPMAEPLLRVRIMRGDARTILYVNQHHVSADALSVANLFQRWSELYRRLSTGETEPRLDVPRFADYVAEERGLIGSAKLEEARTFWEGSAATSRTDLTFYGARTAGSGRTRRIRVALGADRTARLRARSQEAPFQALTGEQSRYFVLSTVLAALVHRMGDTNQVAIGTPWHNRASARRRESLGLFIELYPLRVGVDPDETWASLARKVASFTMRAARHVVPGASRTRDARGFAVVLNFITARIREFAGLTARANWVHSGHGDPQHRLRLQVHDFGGTDEPTLDFDVDVAVFDEQAQRWVVDHFLRLFDALVEDPNARIDEVCLTSWDDEAAFAPRGPRRDAPGSVLERIRDQARRTPDAPAVLDGPRTLSYARLLDAAAALAARLRERGVGPADDVGILLGRSGELVVAILGVMQAGATYVPLDPDHPDVRLQTIAADAGLDALIVSADSRERIADWGAVPRVVELAPTSAETPSRTHASNQPSGRMPAADDLAYVLYTSGSTGRPKGVEVTHGALADYISWAARSYTGGTPTSFPLFTSPGFDLTVTSIFTPLVVGGSIVVYRNEAAGGALLVRRVFEDDIVDVVKLTPSHLGLIRDLELTGSRVRRLILGGENLSTAVAARAHAWFDGRVEIYNEYGPTEATVGCMIHRYDPALDAGDSVPIGIPADNVRIHILDEGGRPTVRGRRGEIHIGGPRLARGYRNDPEQTAQAFVSIPGTPDSTVYATGDLGRWDDQGRLEFLGRRDDQIKLRGVRMEMGEIESALLRHPDVSHAALQLVRTAESRDRHCRVCGLEGAHPEAHLDDDDLCAVCQRFEQEREKVSSYFGTMDDLARMLADARAAATGPHDTLMLLSGGKDSTYALCQIVEMGARPLVFMLDNGYISEQAITNGKRVVDQLGLELVIGGTDAIADIFADSLARYSNVCNGCFKAIYTLAMNLAAERGIPAIVTGLSRGQIFETRLADLYRRGIYDPAEVDKTILEARKAYHRMDDAVSRAMDTRIFETDDALEATRFIDFYRYCDVDLEDLLAYVGEHTPWIRPSDTGRSTNCLINQAGIFVHQAERGFHNYTLPYSWDVRLGHKKRDAVLAELDDDLDPAAVRRMLDEVGYRENPPVVPEARLIAYYTSDVELGASELRSFLSGLLPAEAVPSSLVRLEAIPLTANGKVDHAALPKPTDERPLLGAPFVAPTTEVEARLVEIWCEVLGLNEIGVEDDFFELGGDSMHSIQIVSLARDRDLAFEPRDLFAHPTVAALARVTDLSSTVVEPEAASVSAAELAELDAEFGS